MILILLHVYRIVVFVSLCCFVVCRYWPWFFYFGNNRCTGVTYDTISTLLHKLLLLIYITLPGGWQYLWNNTYLQSTYRAFWQKYLQCHLSLKYAFKSATFAVTTEYVLVCESVQKKNRTHSVDGSDKNLPFLISIKYAPLLLNCFLSIDSIQIYYSLKANPKLAIANHHRFFPDGEYSKNKANHSTVFFTSHPFIE